MRKSGDQPRNLGSGPAGISHPWLLRPPGAPHYVRGCCATVVRRNGASLNELCKGGGIPEARASYEKRLALTGHEPDRRFIARRLEELQ